MFFPLPLQYCFPSLPLSFCPHQETPSSSYLLILLFSPGSFYQFRVEHLLPAVLALAICPSLRHRHTKRSTLHTYHRSLSSPPKYMRSCWDYFMQIQANTHREMVSYGFPGVRSMLFYKLFQLFILKRRVKNM